MFTDASNGKDNYFVILATFRLRQECQEDLSEQKYLSVHFCFFYFIFMSNEIRSSIYNRFV